MRYFSIEYEWYSRPLYRKGKLKTAKKTFAASDQTEAYRLAQEDGKQNFPRHRWKIIGCLELTVPS
jgi:hypothetical protein